MSFGDFSFKLDGHAVSASLAAVNNSVLSACCATRIHLSQSGNTYTGAVSVQIGGAWLTCVVPLLVSVEENVHDLVLGRDWQSYLHELCAAVNIRVPDGLVRSYSFFCPVR